MMVLGIVTVVLITDIVLSGFTTRELIGPLEKLRDGARNIAHQNLDFEIEYDEKSEFMDVFDEFNNMRLELKKSREDAKSYEERRKIMLAGMSHDLRLPLTSIRGYAEGIRDGIADNKDKINRYCQAIITRAGDLERLASSLSSFVQLEREDYKFKTEPVELASYLESFLNKKQLYFEANNVTIDYKSEEGNDRIDILADIDGMDRIFNNLIENAIKYRTDDKSVITIRCGLAKDGRASIRIKDDGPGVSESELPKIFDIFYRTDTSRTKQENGSGIGLSVVKKVVEGCGGEIRAYCENGLAFEIRFPLCSYNNS